MRLIDADKLCMHLADVQLSLRGSDLELYDFIDDVIAAVDEQPTIEQPQWISCAERLPNEDGKYLTYRIDEVRWGEFTSRMSCLSIEFYSVDFDGWWNDGVKLNDVTHWMPLPQPPKGDE